MQAAVFYATDADTYYDIYLVENFEGIEDMDRESLLQSGLYRGQRLLHDYLLGISRLWRVEQRFAVIVQIYTKGSSHPVAIE